MTIPSNTPLVTLPDPQPPALGILTLGNEISMPDDRWVGGVRWVPAGFGAGPGVAAVQCAPGSDELTLGDDNRYCPDPAFGRPIVLFARADASNFNGIGDDLDPTERAQDKLETFTDKLAGFALWEGVGDPDTVPLADPSADDATLGGGAVGIRRSIALMEQAIADHSAGGPAFIHMRPLIAALAAEYGVVDEGITPNGHFIVADPGYAGTGPNAEGVADDSEWIYATQPVSYVLSDIETHGAPIIASNDVSVIAQRVVVFAWDTSVLHVSLEVDPST